MEEMAMNVTDNSNTPPQQTAKKVTVVSFGPRLLAFLIDAVLVAFFGFVLAFVLGFVGSFLLLFTPDRPIPLEALIIICGIVFSIAYYVAAWAKSGQTLGKGLVGLKVVGHDGKPPTGGKAFLRYVGYLISGLILSLGFLWVAFDRKRQGWHDKIAGTYVVYVEAEFSDVTAVDLEPSDGKPGWIWVVLWLIMTLILPVGFVGALLAAGPYVGALLLNLARGAQ